MILKDESVLNFLDGNDDWEPVDNYFVEERRSCNRNAAVSKHRGTGKYYRGLYLTHHDEGRFPDGHIHMEVIEVEPVVVETVVYKLVDGDKDDKR